MIDDDFEQNYQSKGLFGTGTKLSNQSTAINSGTLAATGNMNSNNFNITSGLGVTSPLNFKMTSPFGSRFFQDVNQSNTKMSPAATHSGAEIDRQIEQ